MGLGPAALATSSAIGLRYSVADERIIVDLLDVDLQAWGMGYTGEHTAALWRLRRNGLVEWGCWDRYGGRWRAIVVNEERRDEVLETTHPIPVLTPAGRRLAISLLG